MGKLSINPSYLFSRMSLTITIATMSRSFACLPMSGRPGFNPKSNPIKDSKIVLDAALLNTQHYKLQIKGKMEQSRKRNSALPYTSVL